MRTLALAAVMGVAVLAGGIAYAETFTHPDGRLVVSTPSTGGWVARTQRQRDASGHENPYPSMSVARVFDPQANDCYIFSVDNAETAQRTANEARHAAAPLSPEGWSAAANQVSRFFPNRNASVTSQSVDTSGFWPVQRAELSGAGETVYGAISARPGVELRAFCKGPAHDTIFASLAHPNDAAWQSQAGEQETARETAQAAADAAAQTQQQQQQQNAEPEICRDPTVPSRDPRRRRCRNN